MVYFMAGLVIALFLAGFLWADWLDEKELLKTINWLRNQRRRNRGR